MTWQISHGRLSLRSSKWTRLSLGSSEWTSSRSQNRSKERKRGINSNSSKRYSGYNGNRCLSNNIQNKSKAGIDISSRDSSRSSNRFNSSNNGRKRN